jgi:hypothetical protein
VRVFALEGFWRVDKHWLVVIPGFPQVIELRRMTPPEQDPEARPRGLDDALSKRNHIIIPRHALRVNVFICGILDLSLPRPPLECLYRPLISALRLDVLWDGRCTFACHDRISHFLKLICCAHVSYLAEFDVANTE